MRRTPWSRLLLVAAVVAAFSAAVLHLAESRGWLLVAPPPLATVVMLGIAVVVGRLGWNVRQYVRGKRPGLDPLLAARTVVLATAAAYTGAVLTGWYTGHVLVVLGRLGHPPLRDFAISAAVAAAGAVVLAVAGVVAERWCEVPPSDDDNPPDGVSAGSPA
ncbi:DUF3180 domain-containing protein [Isoptericola sp. b441]|uniref:DUF3180 domain-containing protein n=1 Tax=Actinotalea lenta TaxID=3064654 RepID=A0ABT9D6X5_9CELL|nr:MULTISPECIES: DUF3180 domain-containing protein [unclassified Isoptericola]MDO8106589.1 DUF3180 domain-containing protein [Isoptericola sp. b441]MDO8121703.1 DUF3180 domain-containing protein [Isoptericola sp. b490]